MLDLREIVMEAQLNNKLDWVCLSRGQFAQIVIKSSYDILGEYMFLILILNSPIWLMGKKMRRLNHE